MTQSFTSDLLVLDDHTRYFFDQKWHERSIEARFRLPGKGLQHRVFVGRLVPFRGAWYPVIQEERGSDEQAGETPCFIGGCGLPVVASKRPSPVQIISYWQEHLRGEERALIPQETLSLRTLDVQRLSRCHFDADSRLGCEVDFLERWNLGSGHGQIKGLSDLRDLRNGPAKRLDLPDMPIALTLSRATSGKDWLCRVVDMGAQFHQEMDALLHDPQERVGRAFHFFSGDDIARLCEVVGCDAETLNVLMRLHRLALSSELGTNASLSNAKRVVWPLFSTEPLVVDGVTQDVPSSLEALRQQIYAHLGLERRYLGYEWSCAETLEEFVQEMAWDWARYESIMVENDNAHEIAMALSAFNESLEAPV